MGGASALQHLLASPGNLSVPDVRWKPQGKRSWPSSKSQTWVSTGASSSTWTTQSWTEGVGRGGELEKKGGVLDAVEVSDIRPEKVGNEGEVENNIFER
jgi:hypothetical protein